MTDLLSNKITGVKLGISKLPNRKQECFYFEKDDKIIPVAYISNNLLDEVNQLWDKLLRGIPSKEGKCQKS